ncbi:hypothetical protein ACKWTF_003178 [Chironomus riparius]
MELQCTFGSYTTIVGQEYYRCLVENQILTTTGLELIGEHLAGKTNEDIDFIMFSNCNLEKIPKGFTALFPNLKKLQIYKSNLIEINKNDLAEYHNLERLSFIENNLRFLPDNLFENFKNLKSISFFKNELKFIEPNILIGLDKLENVDFRWNPEYNICYSIRKEDCLNASTIEDVKDEIWNVHLSNPLKVAQYSRKFNPINSKNKKLSEDLVKIIKNDSLKDFKIKIEKQEISAHRLVLAARSPYFYNLLSNNCLHELIEDEIPFDIVDIAIKFMYTEKFPDNEVDYFNLLAGAIKYGIKPLKEFAIGKIIHSINPDNAFDVFKEANKHSELELMSTAFDEIKKKYPKIEFSDE